MTSLLSSISGKFQVSIISSTVIPVLIFVVLLRVLVIPIVPNALESNLIAPLKTLDDAWELFLMLLVVIVLSVLLYNMNTPVIRLFEGYLWKESWFGRWRTHRYQAELDLLLTQDAGLPHLLATLKEQQKGGEQKQPPNPSLQERITCCRMKRQEVYRRIYNDFPKRESILPTRLGNVIRSFENYPERQYKMAAITLYPRLIAKIDKEYANATEETKTGFDFMLNSAMLSGLLAALLLLAGAIYPHSLVNAFAWLQWFVEFCLFLFLSSWFYSQSIGRAYDWGSLIKGSFDLYRGALLAQLGYRQQPKDVSAERSLWSDISERMIYGDLLDKGGQPLNYQAESSPSTYAYSNDQVALEVTRGVNRADGNQRITVTLAVRNVDETNSAHNITLVDTVPEGFGFEWDSAKSANGQIVVHGLNPYRFVTDVALDVGKSYHLTYCIVPLTANGNQRP